jgi:hypothetical protein
MNQLNLDERAVRSKARSRRPYFWLLVCVLVLALGGCGDVILGVGNPNGCSMKVGRDGALPNPHKSSTVEGEISGDVVIDCAAAPQAHEVAMTMFRSLPGQNDWERLAGGTEAFPSKRRFQATMHPYHIQCPGRPYDYQFFARHRYEIDNVFGAWSQVINSKVVPINC